jgi:dienelactone hydrolase
MTTRTEPAFEALELARDAEALVAWPVSGGRAAAAINHGNPGVPAYLRSLARRLAGVGIAAAVLAGDGRVEPRAVADVSSAEKAEWRTEWFAEQYLATTRELVQRLRSELDDIALIGFCGGGWQAMRLAAEGVPISRVVALHAAVRFAPEDPRDDLLTYVPGVHVPLQFHFGANDELTPPADIDQLRRAFQRHGRDAEIYLYPDAGHGFLDPEEHPDTFDEAAAELATTRLVDFLLREPPRAG